MTTPAPKLSLVQTGELTASGQFVYTAGKGWTAKTLSGDAGNLLSAGSEAYPTIFIGQAAIRAAQALATLTPDTTNHQLVFNDGLGHITNIPVAYTAIQDTGLSLAGTVLTVTESNGGASQSIDLGAFIQMLATTNTSGIALSGSGHDANSPLTATLLLDSTAVAVGGFVNMIRMKATGAIVDPADIVTLMNAKTTVGFVATAASGVATLTVNGQSTSIGVVQLVDSTGAALGLAFAPA